MNTLKENARYTDLTKIENSVGYSIESLVSNLGSLTFNEIREAFLEIIEGEEITISQVKANKYRWDLERIHSMLDLQKFITNIYLRSANLGLK